MMNVNLNRVTIQPPVANIPALQAIDASNRDAGSLVFCRSLGFFYYDPDSTIPPDNIKVIQANPSGRYIALNFTNPEHGRNSLDLRYDFQTISASAEILVLSNPLSNFISISGDSPTNLKTIILPPFNQVSPNLNQRSFIEGRIFSVRNDTQNTEITFLSQSGATICQNIVPGMRIDFLVQNNLSIDGQFSFVISGGGVRSLSISGAFTGATNYRYSVASNMVFLHFPIFEGDTAGGQQNIILSTLPSILRPISVTTAPVIVLNGGADARGVISTAPTGVITISPGDNTQPGFQPNSTAGLVSASFHYGLNLNAIPAEPFTRITTAGDTRITTQGDTRIGFN